MKFTKLTIVISVFAVLGMGRGLADELMLTCKEPIPGKLSQIEIFKGESNGQPEVIVEESYPNRAGKTSSHYDWAQWWDSKKGGLPLAYKGDCPNDQYTLVAERDRTWRLKKVCGDKLKEAKGGCAADGSEKACAMPAKEGGKSEGVANPVTCTSRALNFTLKTAGGDETVELDDLLETRKVVAINIFNPKCPDCQMAESVLEKVYQGFSSKDVEFLSVWTPWKGDTEEIAKFYAAVHQSSWPVLFDPAGNVRKDYGVTAVPTICVVLPDHNMPYCEVREEESRKKDPKGDFLRKALDEALFPTTGQED